MHIFREKAVESPQRRRIRPRTNIGFRRLEALPPDLYFVTFAYTSVAFVECVCSVERTLIISSKKQK